MVGSHDAAGSLERLTMRTICFLLPVFVLVGCATQPPHSTVGPAPAASPVTEQPSPADSVVTRYELGVYRYPRDGQSSHKRAIYRRTRVSFPANQRERGHTSDFTYMPPSFDPLPPSAELDAELSAQREITDRIRRGRQAMADLEQQARRQYTALVTHTQETARLSQHLETERARLRELEARLQEKLHATSTPATVTESPVPASTPTQEIKW